MREFVTVIISASTGALGAYLGALWGSRQQARRTIYERIHESRMRLYKHLWKKTGSLPRRPKNSSTTYGEIAQLGVELRDWYYDEGGMYLSGGSRRAYSELQDTIEDRKRPGEQSAPLSDSDYEAVRFKGSKLRSALTLDLLSRSRPPTGRKFKTDSI